jgi:hypothetical protein
VDCGGFFGKQPERIALDPERAALTRTPSVYGLSVALGMRSNKWTLMQPWNVSPAVEALCRGLPSLPVFAVHRGKDGCWKVLVPEPDPHEPAVRVAAVLREPCLNKQPDVPVMIKVSRFRGRTGGAGRAWSR